MTPNRGKSGSGPPRALPASPQGTKMGALNLTNDSFWSPHGAKSSRRQRAKPLKLQQLVPPQERRLIEPSKLKNVSFA